MDGYIRKEKVRIEVQNDSEEMEHFHQDIEMIYVLEGNLSVEIGENTIEMNAEDIYIINANKRHRLHGSQDVLFVRFLIEYQLISDIINSVDIIFWCDSTKDKDERYDKLRMLLKKLLNHYLTNKEKTADFGYIALCYQILELLSVHFLVQIADKEHIDEQDRFEERILQINNYIRLNYNQQISLKELSEKLFLSNGYLSRFFKKNYGMSFAEYLTNIRLYHAVDELIYTDTPITRIAFDNGFASVTIFNKAFKKAYGETPSSFRRKFSKEKSKQEKKIQDKTVEMRLERILMDEGIESTAEKDEEKIYMETSTATSKRVVPVWNHMMNIGAAEDLLRSEVREHLVLVKEAFGVKYVRFWNLFAKELLIDTNQSEGMYNFSRLDSILEFILQQGMKPHIELGMKPKRIHKSVQDSLIQIEEQTQINEEHWQMFMDSMMKHFLQRYGQAEVEQWRMELWCDERLPKNKESRDQYFRLFNITYKTVRKYCNFLEVGGCGFRGDYEQETDRQMLIEWGKQECIPDFISMILYAYIRGEEDQDRFSRRSTDREALVRPVKWMRTSMKEAGIQDKKLYVTEWNLTISDRNYINDTCFKGAYVVKNILDFYGMVDDAGYFTGSDRISEYFDSNLILHGGTGLLTKHGILKPAGFAFEFFNRLYPYLISRDSSCIVTTNGHGTYGILCHNMRSLNYNYYFTKENEIEKEHLWKYYEDTKTAELEIVLSDMQDGVYQMKMYRVNEKNGSILYIWKEMQYTQELDREDLKYFKRTCEPKLTIEKIRAEDGRINTKIRMLPNEIIYIKIQKVYET